jgi:hypothetical protein
MKHMTLLKRGNQRGNEEKAQSAQGKGTPT